MWVKGQGVCIKGLWVSAAAVMAARQDDGGAGGGACGCRGCGLAQQREGTDPGIAYRRWNTSLNARTCHRPISAPARFGTYDLIHVLLHIRSDCRSPRAM